MTKNSALLEKKLEQTIKARKALETARKHQVDVLSQFAVKLSLSCKGQDVALDNQLAKFRSALQKGMDFIEFEPLIESMSETLKNQEAINSANSRALEQSILTAGKQLQRIKGLPDDGRRKLRHLLDHELANINATNDYIPVLSKLSGLYQQALQLKLSQADVAQDPTQSQASPEIASELLNLANELTFDEDVSQEVKAIKGSITLNDNIDSLLDSSLNIIRVIVKSIARERQSAQGFLVSLNQTLEELNTSIVETTKHSQSVNKQITSLNKRIEEKIHSLNSRTQEATSISELKSLVDGELKLLSQDLIERERIEHEDKKALYNSFEKINDRINVLESKVNTYKKRLSEQRFKSLLDGLTKLPNRTAFDDRFNQEFHLFGINKGDITLVVIDVDHFKSINDKYGHSAGDKTLQVIARALKKAIRKTDFIARYGGEEFVVLMPGMHLEHAKQPLEKLRNTIKSIPFKFKETQVQITISLGATQFKDGDTPLSAFDRADSALYEAKNSGRDRLCLRE
ncbi:GGDEF domain-containing protein [Pseudoalteromonas byunsanensis]|uniref:diguanylate cyclase n=1 Tax=Pseudoalteromonas byunsanensis TaxID=327939 RepID=A0A1S1N4F9_9GAMM|nr:GGDEF domain-containing protein [Pseudoalteromonas byunsanensis]OHU94325.1 GGDEF domain-containing protein [Pseudoalteromonas byunsanensis]